MQYQKGTQRIEVIVRKDTGGSLPGTNEKDADEVSADGSSKDSKKGLGMSEARKRRLVKTNLTHGLSASHQMADLYINYRIGGLGYENGDQNYQDAFRRNMEKFQDGSNLATSIAMGASYGSWGGPIGAAFGALFGLVTTGSSLSAKYAGREREYNYKMFKENNAIEYNRARANINLTTGRLR